MKSWQASSEIGTIGINKKILKITCVVVLDHIPKLLFPSPDNLAI